MQLQPFSVSVTVVLSGKDSELQAVSSDHRRVCSGAVPAPQSAETEHQLLLPVKSTSHTHHTTCTDDEEGKRKFREERAGKSNCATVVLRAVTNDCGDSTAASHRSKNEIEKDERMSRKQLWRPPDGRKCLPPFKLSCSAAESRG